MLIAEQLGRREDEARIRHRLGLALWGNDDLEGAQQQLYRATDLFESIRREARGTSDYRLSLFDLQTASYQALQVSILCNFSVQFLVPVNFKYGGKKQNLPLNQFSLKLKLLANMKIRDSGKEN